MTMFQPINDNLYRGHFDDSVELREDQVAESGSLLYGHFSVFDTWTEIDSWVEGQFLERFAQGAFKKTMKENRDSIRVQYDHGFDPYVGDSFLGPIQELKEDDEGGYYEVPLLDTDYNRDRILPMLEGRLMNGDKTGSLLGASHRFRVVKDEWVRSPKPSEYNPLGLDERTVREGRLFELGPVPWGAYPDATAAVRSLSDHYTELRIARAGNATRAANRLNQIAPEAATGTTGNEQPANEPTLAHSTGISLDLARAQLALMQSRKIRK